MRVNTPQVNLGIRLKESGKDTLTRQIAKKMRETIDNLKLVLSIPRASVLRN